MADQLFSVADQIVIVSGGSRGIGRAIAETFVDRGAQVVITGRDEATLTETATSLADRGSITPLVCDVSDAEAISKLVDRVVRQFGRIDTLLNVAGVNKRMPAESYSPEEYDFIVNINLRGAFLLSQRVGKVMIDQRSGAQINIDSLNTFAPLKGVLPYAMSKAGMSMMTRGLAAEWGPHGIRVNGIAPGFILTDLTKKLWSDPTMLEWGTTNTPLRRMGETSDLIGAAIFLASSAAGFMTGQTIYVDGGFSAGLNWPIEFA